MWNSVPQFHTQHWESYVRKQKKNKKQTLWRLPEELHILYSIFAVRSFICRSVMKTLLICLILTFSMDYRLTLMSKKAKYNFYLFFNLRQKRCAGAPTQDSTGYIGSRYWVLTDSSKNIIIITHLQSSVGGGSPGLLLWRTYIAGRLSLLPSLSAPTWSPNFVCLICHFFQHPNFLHYFSLTHVLTSHIYVFVFVNSFI